MSAKIACCKIQKWCWRKHLTSCFPKHYGVTRKETKEIGGNKIKLPQKTTNGNFRNKMPMGMIHKIPSLVNWFSCRFYWHETTDKDQNLNKLERGLFLDIPRCSDANEENPNVTNHDKHVCTQLGASFVSLLTRICHSVTMKKFRNQSPFH